MAQEENTQPQNIEEKTESDLYNIMIEINNTGYKQQMAGQLKPYVLLIPMCIPKKQLETIMWNK